MTRFAPLLLLVLAACSYAPQPVAPGYAGAQELVWLCLLTSGPLALVWAMELTTPPARTVRYWDYRDLQRETSLSMKDYTTSPFLLPSVPLGRVREIPDEVSGVYFAIHGTRILYVGKSKNIKARWRGHHKKRELSEVKNVRIHWLDVPPEEITAIESVLINKYDPPLNRAKPLVTPNAIELYSSCGELENISRALFVMGVSVSVGLVSFVFPKISIFSYITNIMLFTAVIAEGYLVSKMGVEL